MSVVKFEEEGIDSRSVEELVKLIRTKYRFQSRDGQFLLAQITALEGLLQYGEEYVGQDRSYGTLLTDQNVAEEVLSRRLGNLPVSNAGADSGRDADDEPPRYEETDAVAAPPEYDG